MKTEQQLKGLQDAIAAKLAGKPWQYRYSNTGMSSPHAPGDWLTESADTDLGLLDLSVYDFRAAPIPVSRPWSKPDDVPGPVCWVRSGDTWFAAMVVCVFNAGICAHANGQHMDIPWSQLRDYTYSTDRKTWHPCTVTEQK